MSILTTVVDAVTVVMERIPLKAIPAVLDLDADDGDVVLEVPSYSQTDGYSCGAIAAWSIVETFRPRANFWKFYQEVSPDPGEGVGPIRVVAVLRKLKIGLVSG